jgi:hypothetical protein
MAVDRQRLVRLKVVPQHPAHTDPVPVTVRGPLRDGPVGTRLAVFDYNRDRDVAFPPARPTVRNFKAPDDPTDLHFQQLNAYAIAERAIWLMENELGRTVSWGFDASRLIVLPHAGEMANAFYSKDTTSLQFYSYRVGGSVQHTCLAHDIVAHETGHALLDAVRGRFSESYHPETAALHEGFADLAAVFAALSHDSVRNLMLTAGGEFRARSAIARIGDEFHGPGLEGRGALRDLADPGEIDFDGVLEPHLLSLKLTRGAFGALQAFFDRNRAQGDDPEKSLKIAHRALQRMVVRGLDYLPPADGTFEDFARAILAADVSANPADGRGYRAALAKLFVDNKIGSSVENLLPPSASTRPWTHDGLPWPPRTAAEAYLFLDQHRTRLALHPKPELRDFVVRRFDVSRAPAPRPAAEPSDTDIDNVVFGYEYPIDIELTGDRFGSLQGLWLTLRGGGTLVFDGKARLRAHARKPVTRPRVKATKDFLAAVINGRLGAVHPAGHGPMRTLAQRRPYSVSVGDQRLRFGANQAAGCGRRMPEEER